MINLKQIKTFYQNINRGINRKHDNERKIIESFKP